MKKHTPKSPSPTLPRPVETAQLEQIQGGMRHESRTTKMRHD